MDAGSRLLRYLGVIATVESTGRLPARWRLSDETRMNEVSWDAGGLTVAGESSQSTTRWSDFYKLRELDDLFLLYFSHALFLMIPKRAFPESDLMLKFRETVTAAIPRR